MSGSWKVKHEGQKSMSPPFHAWHACVQTHIGISCILAAGVFCCKVKDLGLNSDSQKGKVTKSFHSTLVWWSCSSQERLGTVLFNCWTEDGSKCPPVLEIWWNVMLIRLDRQGIILWKLNCFVETSLLQALASVSVLRRKNCRARKGFSSEREDKESILN